MMRYTVSAALGVCCTQCMRYLVYAVSSVNSRSWHGEIERDGLNFVFLGDGRVEDEKERDERGWEKSSCETGT